uniref:Nuclear receptor domain-containing protein n=2 Tax=Parascaris univalens TaxID=6257 RepID=A0A914ZI13_PARUN
MFSMVNIFCDFTAKCFHYFSKTFFRRTIVSHRTYKCHKNGNCIFNKDIRCACRACRFAKCLAVGMNPKAIQCNRTGRIASPNNPPSPPQDPTATSFTSSTFQSSVIYATNSTFADEKTSVKNSQKTFSRASSPNSERNAYKRAYTVSALLDLPQFSPSPSAKESRKISNSLLTACVKEASEICDETPCKRPKSDSSEKLIIRLLTLQENVSRLRNSVYEASDSILDLLTRPCAMDDMSEYMNQKEETELGTAERLNLDIALAIEYAKSFDVFRRMPLRDKFFLLRDVTLVLSLFESAYQSFLRRRSISAIEAIVKLEPNDASHEQGSPVQLAMESLVRAEIDRSEYVLLKAIVFLHAECFGLSSKSYKQLVENRQLVLDALFDYMMST